MMKYRGIYIRNIEAVDAVKLNFKERDYLKSEWTGYIPYSLELLKLKNEGLKIIRKKENVELKDEDFIYNQDSKKNRSLDLINVNFTTSYRQTDLSALEIKKQEIYEKYKNNNSEEIKNELKTYKRRNKKIKRKIKRRK